MPRDKVTAKQVKAARALLDWSQEDLANNSNLSLSTVRNLEMGFAPRRSTTVGICTTIENAGVEFTEGEGIKRRFADIRIYVGHDSSDRFFDDIVETIKEKGGDLVGYCRSEHHMARALGISHKNHLGRFQSLTSIAQVNCILFETAPSHITSSTCNFRVATQKYLAPSYFFSYGNKYAILQEDTANNFQFAIFAMRSQAEAYRTCFNWMWEYSLPARNR